MINIIPYEKLGGADHGWLKAKHHFSFASYQNPNRVHFGPMRVINDDIVAPQTGFDPHPHDNMEIITYVRKGAITHKDDMGNEGRTEAGDVQVMSAGTGVTHSEYNLENEETNLYQIWMFPNKKNVKPRWDAKKFPKEPVKDKLKPLVTNFDNKDKDSLKIYQDAVIYAGRINKGDKVTQKIDRNQAYVLCSHGKIKINDKEIKKGDGAEIMKLKSVEILALENCEVLFIDLPRY
jgi:redox-sensitive bicupin YhaK (pirin superfamily)